MTPGTVACQVSLSKGFSRQENWSGLPFPFSRDLPDPGIEPGLTHCRQILYPLNDQGNPGVVGYAAKSSQHTPVPSLLLWAGN